jgi:hypothetical protein
LKSAAQTALFAYHGKLRRLEGVKEFYCALPPIGYAMLSKALAPGASSPDARGALNIKDIVSSLEENHGQSPHPL